MDSVPELGQLSPEARRTLLAGLLRDGARRPQLRPVSFAQERLWFLEQLAPETSFFNIDVAIEIHAQLSPAIVEKSLNEIVRRGWDEDVYVGFRSVLWVAALLFGLANLPLILKDQKERAA